MWWRASIGCPILRGVSNALSVFKGLLSKGGTRKIDDYTVAFHLDAPNGNFPYAVSIDNYNAVILPANYRGNYESDFMGTGPFRLESYRPREGATFVRNPDYWGPKALPDRIEFKFYSDIQPRLLALQAGEVDMLDAIPVIMSPAIRANPDIEDPAGALGQSSPAAYAMRPGAVRRQARAAGSGAQPRPQEAGRRLVPRHGRDGQRQPVRALVPIDRPDGSAARSGYRQGEAADGGRGRSPPASTSR